LIPEKTISMNLFKQISRTSSFIRGYFIKGHERSVNMKRNIFASFIIRILGITISLVLVPLTINYVNSVQYGIWITLSSLIGWLGYFDIGFGNGLRNKLAESIALGDYKIAKVYVSTTYAVMGVMMMTIMVIFILINPFLNWSHILNAPEEMASDLRLLALIVFVLFCCQMFLQLIGTVLTANQQPAKASAFNLISSITSLIAIFILTKTTTGKLIYLGIALCLPPTIVVLFSNLWFYTHDFRACAPSFFHIRLRYIRSLMGLGIKFFIMQIATLVLYQTSNIIIAHLFGNNNVTLYNIGFKYFNVIPMFMLIIMMPLWSAFTDAWTKNEVTWIINTINKLRFIWIGLSIIVVVMLLVSNKVYLLWVGDKLHVPLGISIALSVSIIVNIGAYIYSIFLNGVGIVRIQLILAIVGIVINVPLAIALGKLIGPPGVIIATTLVNALNLIFFNIQYKKIISKSAVGIWLK
jgi:O-antigen/teichoic acid export membrane protein